MADLLVSSGASFAQDLHPWVAEAVNRPGARRLDAMRVVLLRHVDRSQAAPAAFAEAGLPWPRSAGELHAAGALLVARRHPEEVIVTGNDDEAIGRLLAAFAPGRTPDAIAFDLSHGLGCVELDGSRLDDWLQHLVDASAIPQPGRASRCRLADIAVVLLRPGADRVLVIADRALFPYLSDWLAFSHEGEFGET